MSQQENYSKKAQELASLVLKQETRFNLNTSDKFDIWLTHPIFGLIAFALVMWSVFSLSQIWIGPWLSDLLVGQLEILAELITSIVESYEVSPLWSGLLTEGIIGGFIAVIGFLPLIMVLLFFLQLLEDSGYMARVALVFNHYFSHLGLSGASIIPMYIGTACSIPAIMSTKTIKDERQRHMTIMLTPFVPCGAKLPVIALLLSVFFFEQAYMTLLVYALAVLVIYLSGLGLKYVFNPSSKSHQMLVIELPEYKTPSLVLAFNSMIERAKEFIKNAATIIVLMNGIIWLSANFNFQFQMVESAQESMLYFISSPIAFLLIPLGFGFWGFAAAALSGFVAKEEVVGALAVIFVFSISSDFDVIGIDRAREALAGIGGLTSLSALSFLAFNLFTPPCFAAIGAMKSQLKSNKWLLFAVGYQLLVGYVVAMIIYQVGTLLFTKQLAQGWWASILVLLIGIGYIFYARRKVAAHG
jgi:ferrous iron transport protein B